MRMDGDGGETVTTGSENSGSDAGRRVPGAGQVATARLEVALAATWLRLARRVWMGLVCVFIFSLLRLAPRAASI